MGDNDSILDRIALSVIEIPRRFNAGNESTYSLLKNSGYFEHHTEVSEERIHQALLHRPDLIPDWEQLSDDKRTTGWYLRKVGSLYVLGNIPAHGGTGKTPIEYTNRFRACAAFIKREIEDIRQIP